MRNALSGATRPLNADSRRRRPTFQPLVMTAPPIRRPLGGGIAMFRITHPVQY